jgi:hypothetical protein
VRGLADNGVLPALFFATDKMTRKSAILSFFCISAHSLSAYQQKQLK